MKPISPALTGWWTPNGFPEEVFISVGYTDRKFKRARWKQAYAGVVAQYREDVPRNSMHLFVRADGTFEINHLDADNPDHGRVVEHLMNDTAAGPIVASAALLGGIVLFARALTSATE